MEKGYEVRQIKTFSMGYANYSYIVVDKLTRIALVIDPSWEYKKLVNEFYQLDLQLKAILLTHSHYDHVNQVEPLVSTFNPQVYMSKTEIDFSGFRCSNLNELKDLDEIHIGKTKILCLLTPGHTPGSMCYHVSDSLFTGDTIFIEGCGACSFKGGSAEAMFDSVQRIKSMLHLHMKIYPGHSYGQAPGQTTDSLMRNNIYFQFDKKEHFVQFRMRENQKGLFNFK